MPTTNARATKATRRVAMQALCIQLELHDVLVTTVFYPALSAVDPSVGTADRDHDQVRALVGELRGRNDCDASCDGVIAQLKALVAVHVRREEHDLFPRLEKQGEQWLCDLGLALVKRKEELVRSTEEFEGPAT